MSMHNITRVDLWDEAVAEMELEEYGHSCPMCDTRNFPAGSLGTTQHYHCRACGWWYSDSEA